MTFEKDKKKELVHPRTKKEKKKTKNIFLPFLADVELNLFILNYVKTHPIAKKREEKIMSSVSKHRN